MNEKDYSKGFLKEKFAAHHVEPPESVWTNISSRLGGRNRRGLVIIVLSAAATIALAITLGITYFGNRVPDQAVNLPADQGTFEQQPGLVTPGESAGERMGEYSRHLADEGRTGEAEDGAGRDLQAGREGAQTGRLERKVEGILEKLEPREKMTRQEVLLPGEQGERSVLAEPADAGDMAEEPGADLQPEPGIDAGADLQPEPEVDAGTDLLQEVEEDQGTDLSLETEKEPGPDVVPEAKEDQGTERLQEGEWADDEGKRKARWIVGAAMSPLYSFRDAEAGAAGGFEDFESGLVAYAGGVHVSYHAAKRVAIETGLFFNKMGVSIGASGIRMFNSSVDNSPLEGASDRSNWVAVNNSIGNIVSKSGDIYVNEYKLSSTNETGYYTELNNQDVVVANEGIRQHLDYLELPLNVRYTMVDRTFELQLVGGMSTNFLIQNYITRDTPSGPEEVGYLTNVRSVNYSGNAGLGMIYHLHKQISLRLEPRFRYFLNSVNDGTLPATRPYSLGLYTGFTYTF